MQNKFTRSFWWRNIVDIFAKCLVILWLVALFSLLDGTQERKLAEWCREVNENLVTGDDSGCEANDVSQTSVQNAEHDADEMEHEDEDVHECTIVEETVSCRKVSQLLVCSLCCLVLMGMETGTNPTWYVLLNRFSLVCS